LAKGDLLTWVLTINGAFKELVVSSALEILVTTSLISFCIPPGKGERKGVMSYVFSF
jgi:hypothetical protein